MPAAHAAGQSHGRQGSMEPSLESSFRGRRGLHAAQSAGHLISPGEQTEWGSGIIQGPHKHPELPALACQRRKVPADLQAQENITKDWKHEEFDCGEQNQHSTCNHTWEAQSAGLRWFAPGSQLYLK